MKRNFALILVAALLALSLSACGSSAPAATPAPAPAETEAPAAVLPDAVLTEAEDEPAAEENELLATAKEFIDKPVADLIAAIGEPISAEYAPSCLGSGEDGELTYDGFTVYTYKEGDTETVNDVE